MGLYIIPKDRSHGIDGINTETSRMKMKGNVKRRGTQITNGQFAEQLNKYFGNLLVPSSLRFMWNIWLKFFCLCLQHSLQIIKGGVNQRRGTPSCWPHSRSPYVGLAILHRVDIWMLEKILGNTILTCWNGEILSNNPNKLAGLSCMQHKFETESGLTQGKGYLYPI